MRSRFAVPILLVVASTFTPAPGEAQDTIPRWGAEATIGGAAGGGLLRFSNPSRAWIVQSAFQFERISDDPAGDGPEHIVSVDARLGMRFYRRAGEETRPFTTISGILLYQELAGSSTFRPGIALEAGASHFFSRHVSLGVSADLRALYSRDQFGLGFPSGNDRTRISVLFSGFRLLGGVYF